MIRLTYVPDFVEEAVMLAERTMSRNDARVFRQERNLAYEVVDPDERERVFRDLHFGWFTRLELHAPIEQVVNDCQDIAGRLSKGRVLRALRRQEEGADLFDPTLPDEDGRRSPLLALRLRPAMLLDPDALRGFLRHELVHIADMIDPGFGYERALPPSDDGPSADNILRDRYRVLWDVTIDGRLSRAGLAGPEARIARRREFAATFSMLADEAGFAFDEWFDLIDPTHHALVAFAQSPHAPGQAAATATGRCPLCRFPVGSLDARPERLSAGAALAIQRDFPDWTPAMGTCSQCLDLYESHYANKQAAAR
jgi:hypothetical protein